MNASDTGLGRLARGTLVYGLGSVLNRVVTFLLLPVLTRFLSASEYGVSAILDVLCAFLVAVFSLGFGSSMTIGYFETDRKDDRERTVSTAFLILVTSTVVLGLCGLAFAPGISLWTLGDAGHGDLILLSLGTTAMMILPMPFGLRLQFEGAPRAR